MSSRDGLVPEIPQWMVDAALDSFFGHGHWRGEMKDAPQDMRDAMAAAAVPEMQACVAALKAVDGLAEGDETDLGKIERVRMRVRKAINDYDAKVPK